MKYLKEKEKKRLNPLWIVLVVQIIIIIVLVVLLLRPQASEPVVEQPATQPTVAATEKPEETAAPQETVAQPQIQETEPQEAEVEIVTPYCSLYIPYEWSESISTETVPQDFGLNLVFIGTVNGKQADLFTVCFGGEEGFPVGTVTTADGFMLDITIDLAEFSADAGWTDAEIDELSAMQESMNHIISRLRQTPGFVSAE